MTAWHVKDAVYLDVRADRISGDPLGAARRRRLVGVDGSEALEAVAQVGACRAGFRRSSILPEPARAR